MKSSQKLLTHGMRYHGNYVVLQIIAIFMFMACAIQSYIDQCTQLLNKNIAKGCYTLDVINKISILRVNYVLTVAANSLLTCPFSPTLRLRLACVLLSIKLFLWAGNFVEFDVLYVYVLTFYKNTLI